MEHIRSIDLDMSLGRTMFASDHMKTVTNTSALGVPKFLSTPNNMLMGKLDIANCSYDSNSNDTSNIDEPQVMNNSFDDTEIISSNESCRNSMQINEYIAGTFNSPIVIEAVENCHELDTASYFLYFLRCKSIRS